MPRMRLYTTVASYMKVAFAAITGGFNRGHDVEKLERVMADYVGAPHAVAMPQARVGIYFLIKHLVQPGQKVILSPYTISEVVNMVIVAGGVPVFADIERNTCNIDANEVEKLIDDQTAAVLVTHFYGLMCDVERIIEICEPRGIPVIEDAAQAFGATRQGRHAGTIATAGVYSFGRIKNLTTFYGGMVVTGSAALAEKLRASLRAYPSFDSASLFKRAVGSAIIDIATHPLVFRLVTFWLVRYGHLHRIDALSMKVKVDLNPQLRDKMPEDYLVQLSALQARVALQQLPKVASETQKRIDAAELYYQGLKDIDELILPPLILDGSHSYHYFPIQYANRKELVDYCIRNDRDISASHHKNCAAMECFKTYQRACPNADATANSLIYLPTYPSYGVADVNNTIKVIRSFFGR